VQHRRRKPSEAAGTGHPMIHATCHCGAVRLSIPRAPDTLTNCDCSICRRYGTLWAYYTKDEVEVIAGPGVTERCAWGRKSIHFVRCATCGCVTRAGLWGCA
jgi:hypothetical protein